MDSAARILVIDDDENIRSTIAEILRSEGYSVDVASTGSEAISRTKSTAYNAALIDIRLPDIEGIELLTKLHDTTPKIRKIILTGFPSQQNAIAALNNSADAYLLKPVAIDELLHTVYEQLKLQDSERKYSEQRVADFIETRIREQSET